jgi:hypothetical protein
MTTETVPVAITDISPAADIAIREVFTPGTGWTAARRESPTWETLRNYRAAGATAVSVGDRHADFEIEAVFATGGWPW